MSKHKGLISEGAVNKKALEKLPEVFSIAGALIPDSEVIEQASSVATADFVASLIPESSVVVDLTAGLGVNSFSFSRNASKVYSIEYNRARADILRENFNLAAIRNTEVHASDCENWLIANPLLKFDVAFIDPSRRDSTGKRVFRFEDCSPNVVKLLPQLRQHTSRLIIKASPLLDITDACRKLQTVKNVYVVESDHEVKELIFDVDLASIECCAPSVEAVRLGVGRDPQTMKISLDSDAQLDFLSELDSIKRDGYIYEPSPALMKIGKFETLTERFPSLLKFDINSNLFYSDRCFADFPGRIFKVDKMVSSSILKKMKGTECNVISRNHPAKAEEIAVRNKFRSSLTTFLIATTVAKKKVLILTERFFPSV